jgi:hypothetical protein
MGRCTFRSDVLFAPGAGGDVTVAAGIRLYRRLLVDSNHN